MSRPAPAGMRRMPAGPGPVDRTARRGVRRFRLRGAPDATPAGPVLKHLGHGFPREHLLLAGKPVPAVPSVTFMQLVA
ncbi:hypothetical protein GCM10010293_18330 [Streptomyces griseoflavus]|nr:hypothetical protein GCM10010293_18330 [Streptomyces griseoflavus]